MFFISFILAFFIFLLAVSLINLFLSFAIKMVTNNTLDEYKFIIPSVLYLIINSITFLIIYLVTTNVLDLSLKDSIMAIIFKTIDISDKIRTVLLLDLIILISSILLQSLCLLTVNIDYTVTFGKIRMIFKSLKNKIHFNLKLNKKNDVNKDDAVNRDSKNIENNNEVEYEETKDNDISNLAYVIPEGEMAENKEKLKLTFFNSLICTIFILSFIFFMFMGLFTIGSIISSKLL